MSGLKVSFDRRQLVYLRDLLRELVARDLKVRYKGSVLGYAWSFLNPLMHLVVFSFLFRVVLRLNIARYSSFALCGIVAWNWFQASVSRDLAPLPLAAN